MSPRPEDRRLSLKRYALAVLGPAIAVVITLAVQPLVAPSVTPFFILAVAVAASYGGRGPGALASILSVVALSYWFFPPSGTFAIHSPADLARQIVFLTVAAAIASIAGGVHAQRLRAVEDGLENERLRRLAEESATEAEVAVGQALEASNQAEEGALRAREAAKEAETAARAAAGALARQQEAETALRRSEAELSDLFETASIGMHWVAEDGTILRVNQAELDMLGYEREEYVGHRIAEFHVDQSVIQDILRRLVEGETQRQRPARLRCKSGEVKEVLIDSSGYFHEGRFIHSRSFTRDVTAENQSREAAARLAAIVSSSSDGIIGKTLDGVITSWNSAAERIFGYTAAEMVGQSVFKLIPPELHQAERELLDRLRRGEAVEFSESERIGKDGRRLWISLSVSPIRDGSGVVTGAASIKRDITERKIVEEHLRETQRLQAVGQLAGGIAHEANNQMMVVLGGAHFLLRRPDLPDVARLDVEQIRRAAERTASITQQLLAFSRRQVLQLQQVDLNSVVQSIGPVLRRSLAEHQSLIVRLGRLGTTVRADPRQLEQVLLNLTLNARDAMPNGGELTIETSEVELRAADADKIRLAPGTYELLVVQDTGHGMDHATLKRVFEPFFTTKDVGKGTGLGLSVVHGIVSQTGGHIQVETAPGKGATFRLYFPAAPRDPSVALPDAGEPAAPAAGTVALVVEDDASVRAMATRALTEAGYRVVEAENGRTALELVRAQARLDLVVTDVGMPEMDGYELARCLHSERPELPVVFMSGYGDRDYREQSLPGPARPLLQKPFSPDTLVRAVGEVLRAE
jgi:PAS domain S-box-containing protein